MFGGGIVEVCRDDPKCGLDVRLQATECNWQYNWFDAVLWYAKETLVEHMATHIHLHLQVKLDQA